MERPSSDARRLTSPWLLLGVGATVLTVLTSAQHWVVMHLSAEDPDWRTLRHALSNQAPIWFLWAAAGPLVAAAVRTVPLRRDRLLTAVPIHVAIALVMVVVHEAGVLAAHRLFGFPTPPGPFWTVFGSAIIYRMTVGLSGYAILFGAIVAADYYARWRERDLAAAALGRQLAEARLQALRMQLNPHFLFNTMNTIAMLARQGDNALVVRMVADLSGILRHVLEESPPEETSLGAELEFIERYLDLERVRFSDRLQVTIEVPDALMEARVPNLVLQPLVENAIKHGIAKRARAGRIVIGAYRRGAELELTVSDDGPGLGDADADRTGIGLANTRARLAELYGARARVELIPALGGGAISRVTMPFRLTAPVVEPVAVG